jgi:uncharacterized protein with HEPN domain
MNKDDRVYLHHILECIRRIVENIMEGRERFYGLAYIARRSVTELTSHGRIDPAVIGNDESDATRS